jgi:hypothetical protein
MKNRIRCECGSTRKAGGSPDPATGVTGNVL